MDSMWVAANGKWMIRAAASRSLPRATIAVALLFLTVGKAQAQTNVAIGADALRIIGGVGVLDRAKYFNFHGTLQGPGSSNLGNLRQETWSPTGLNAATGRAATELDQFISNGLPEDASKPGFFDHAALVNAIQGSYRSFVLSGTRWEGLRNYDNPIFIQSGRNGGFWPNFLDGGGLMPTNYEAYADFLNVYLEEAVYGTGPSQGFLPIEPERFYLEVMNEPNWSSPTQNDWNEVIAMHRVVTEQVKELFPQTRIGGPSCCDDLGSGINGWDRARQLMDDMATWQTPSGESVELDFWVIHPYERYDVQANGSWKRQIEGSPGHVSAIMDLYETYSNISFGDPKAFAITEYGSWNRTNMPDGSYGNYSRDEQRWDLVRDVREKMMVFMDRPDRIINATPFVSPKQWQSSPTPHPDADNVFWEQNGSGGPWTETIVASMFRMFNDVRGRYVDVSSDNPDLQTIAYRDGNQLYIVLNNLEKSDTTLNLQAVSAHGNVSSASLDRIYWNGSEGVYESDLDVSTSWQNLTLAAEEGAVLTLTLTGPELYDIATNEVTYYGDSTLSPITGPAGQSSILNYQVDTEDAVSARVRVAFNRGNNDLGEGFFVLVNDNPVQVRPGELEFDDSDTDLVTREVDVPLDFLVDGSNEVYADFTGAGGELVTAVLVVTHTVGDFNGSGAFDGEDVSLLLQHFGPATEGSKFDLVVDGVVDGGDLIHWFNELRGVPFAPGDFDLDGNIDEQDLALWVVGLGDGTHYGLGDIDFDGDTDGADFLGWQRGFTGSAMALAAASTVAEPSALLSLVAAGLLAASCRTVSGPSDVVTPKSATYKT